MKTKYDLENKINMDQLQNFKDFDFVEYCGGEYWKPNRHIVDKAGKRKWYWDSPEKNKKFNPEIDSKEKMTDIEHFQEEAWMFCDTIDWDNAERNIHYFDYATTGERMGWKEGDEYWLVFNCAMQRFEIRKADSDKWTPLERYFIDKNLELKFKWMYKYYKNFEDYMQNKFKIKYIKTISFNSFPDRIEVSSMNEFKNQNKPGNVKFDYPMCVFDAYEEFSSIKNTFKNLSLVDPNSWQNNMYEGHFLWKYFKEKFNNKEIFQKVEEMRENGTFNSWRRYNIYDESLVEDPKKYMEIFYKYNHTYNFHLKKEQKKK